MESREPDFDWIFSLVYIDSGTLSGGIREPDLLLILRLPHLFSKHEVYKYVCVSMVKIKQIGFSSIPIENGLNISARAVIINQSIAPSYFLQVPLNVSPHSKHYEPERREWTRADYKP